MEITIEKVNGEPMSDKEAAALFRYFHDKLMPPADKEDHCSFCKQKNFSHDVEIFLQEDDSYIYAAAFCPGISKDRLEVMIDGWDLIIRTKPADPDAEKGDSGKGHFLWKCFDDLSYEGETELPNDVIAEQATAELSNGVLFITLPKPEAVKPKTVAVK